MDEDSCVEEGRREELIKGWGEPEGVVRHELDRRISETTSQHAHFKGGGLCRIRQLINSCRPTDLSWFMLERSRRDRE